MNDKINLKKIYAQCYGAKEEVGLIEIPPLTYIGYEGIGAPYSPAFQEAMTVLYGLVYTVKFQCKGEGRDFVVMPLEGQWWSEIPEKFRETEKDEWRWKVMIPVPDFVDGTLFERGRSALSQRKNPPGLERAVLEVVADGLSAQFLYRGPYAKEGPYIERMHRYIEDAGYRLRSRHREIYLNSPQRVTSEEKLRTIIRQPVEKG